MRSAAFSVLALVVLCLAGHTALAQPAVYTTDSKTGCKVANPFPKPNEAVSWSGACVEGMASGTGTVVWTVNGLTTFRQTYTETNGGAMKDGVEHCILDMGRVRMDFSAWQTPKSKLNWSNSGSRTIDVYVPEETDLSITAVRKAVLSLVLPLIKKQTPAPKAYDDISVRLRRENVSYSEPYPFDVLGKIESLGPTAFTYYRDTAWIMPVLKEKETALARERATQQAAKDKLKAEQEAAARAEAARREAEVRAAQERKREAKRADFRRRNGVSEFLSSIDDLNTNPFPWKGKVVGVCLVFNEMLSESTAALTPGIMSDINVVFSSVPTTQFRKTGTRFLLAGRVTGKAQVKTAFGDASLVHLTFVAAEPVQSCGEVFGNR